MAELPPKIPSMTQNWSNAFLPHQRMDTFITTTAEQQQQPQHHHQPHQQPCWVDEFLDFASARRGAHRRSVSDSIAFLESPLVMMEDQECRRHNNNNNIMHGFERLDDEQLIMSMFSDDMSLSAAAGAVAGEGAPPAVSSSNPSTPSDQNSNNDGIKPTVALHQPHDQRPKTEPGEVESPCEGDPHAPPPQPLSTDSIIDPKRVKRILANRQSAQRSRVRKLQYISELEHSVTTLQSEVSALSPRVAFLDHHRLILNVDNSALKQRIAALAQDKIFKDAHQEALKKEIERLRQVYHQQNLKKKNMQQQQQQQGINQNSHPPPPSTDQQISDIALATTCAGKEQISIHS